MNPQAANNMGIKMQFKKVLIGWHFFSVASLLLTIMIYGVTSTNLDQDVSNSVSDQDNTDLLPTTTPEIPSGNHSEEVEVTLAANCTLDVKDVCFDNMNCSQLGGDCLDCEFNISCPYGSKQIADCKPRPGVNCSGDREFQREYECRYCYQLPHWHTWCNQTMDCALNKPRQHYPARPFFVSTCWAKREYLCMGRRCFHKQLPCNWSQGYKWSTAMLLSIFLGGFGVDRFYLGLWREGIGKLLSFGGLGVWTLVDVILIAVGYIGPWDGSLYI